MKPLPIFVGYDPREHMAYDVTCHSIRRRASKPVLIAPLYLPHLTRVLGRWPITIDESGQMWDYISKAPVSTEFAISRFCVPFIQDDGWALFVDCDIVCTTDISRIFELADDKYAVMVVKHEHSSPEGTKMDGQIQSDYPRKNWSSVTLWNCSHPSNRKLTWKALHLWAGRDLHAFKWLQDEEIGSLPPTWNWLVDVYPNEFHPLPNILHYTLGGPWIPYWSGGSADFIWGREHESLLETKSEVLGINV